MNGLQVIETYKSFGDIHALNGVSFEVSQGEILCILGPSGCGKSTLLSVIAGLEMPDQGDIRWNGESLSRIPAYKRGFGLMFQDYALFPHLNVSQNISFGLRMAGIMNDKSGQRVREMLSLVGLPGYDNRDVNSLSGGEQQRVALARSLAPKPCMLMLDEPLGALDKAWREHLLQEMREILSQINQTTIYVTHDQEEAFALADRVLVMQFGKIIQIGTPEEIYCRPTSVFLAQFLGLSNFLPGIINIDREDVFVNTLFGNWQVDKKYVPNDGDVMVLIRSDAVYPNKEGVCSLHGFVTERIFRGSQQRIEIEVINQAGERLRFKFEFSSHEVIPDIGGEIVISFNPLEAIQVFPSH